MVSSALPGAHLPDVSAIIVNYRSASHTLSCIETLLQQTGADIEILVVDNASGDGGIAQIRKAYPDIKLIENANNDGFAKANNLAAAEARGEYILVINPDIRLLSTDVVAGLAASLEADSSIGVIGPDIIESRREKRVMPRYRYPLQKKLKRQKSLMNLPGNIAWILGACMLFPKHVYEQVKGFDNDFFLYGEDTDICLRLRQAGYSIVWEPKYKVDHWAGASESGSRTYDTRVRKKRGYYQFCLKHYVKADLMPVLRRQYWKCRLNLCLLRLRGMLLGKRPVTAIDRNQAEKDVLEAIVRAKP
ncbi:MAG TPA: glycosyltransferase family 2 protein [Methylophilaceae bacterium]|jgi:GT2 family glycosyltransferase